MTRIPLVQAVKQRFTIDSNNTRVDCGLDYNGNGDFFSSSFSWGDRLVSGRRVIPNANLIPKSLTKEIGGFMMCNDMGNPNADRNALFSNELSLFQIDPLELLPENAKNEFAKKLFGSLVSLVDESKIELVNEIVDEVLVTVDILSEESIGEVLNAAFDRNYARLCEGILNRLRLDFLDLDLCRGLLRDTIDNIVKETTPVIT